MDRNNVRVPALYQFLQLTLIFTAHTADENINRILIKRVVTGRKLCYFFTIQFNGNDRFFTYDKFHMLFLSVKGKRRENMSFSLSFSFSLPVFHLCFFWLLYLSLFAFSFSISVKSYRIL